MNSFLCLLLPSIISIKMYIHLNNNKILWYDLLMYYFIFILFNHLFSTFFSVLLFGLKNSVEVSIYMFPMFAVKYCIVSIFISVLLPIFFQVIRLNINYRVEVKKVEKNKKENKKIC